MATKKEATKKFEVGKTYAHSNDENAIRYRVIKRTNCYVTMLVHYGSHKEDETKRFHVSPYGYGFTEGVEYIYFSAYAKKNVTPGRYLRAVDVVSDWETTATEIKPEPGAEATPIEQPKPEQPQKSELRKAPAPKKMRVKYFQDFLQCSTIDEAIIKAKEIDLSTLDEMILDFGRTPSNKPMKINVWSEYDGPVDDKQAKREHTLSMVAKLFFTYKEHLQNVIENVAGWAKLEDKIKAANATAPVIDVEAREIPDVPALPEHIKEPVLLNTDDINPFDKNCRITSARYTKQNWETLSGLGDNLKLARKLLDSANDWTINDICSYLAICQINENDKYRKSPIVTRKNAIKRILRKIESVYRTHKEMKRIDRQQITDYALQPLRDYFKTNPITAASAQERLALPAKITEQPQPEPEITKFEIGKTYGKKHFGSRLPVKVIARDDDMKTITVEFKNKTTDVFEIGNFDGFTNQKVETANQGFKQFFTAFELFIYDEWGEPTVLRNSEQPTAPEATKPEPVKDTPNPDEKTSHTGKKKVANSFSLTLDGVNACETKQEIFDYLMNAKKQQIIDFCTALKICLRGLKGLTTREKLATYLAGKIIMIREHEAQYGEIKKPEPKTQVKTQWISPHVSKRGQQLYFLFDDNGNAYEERKAA